MAIIIMYNSHVTYRSISRNYKKYSNINSKHNNATSGNRFPNSIIIKILALFKILNSSDLFSSHLSHNNYCKCSLPYHKD